MNAALGPLDYRVPEGMAVEPGSVVVAPLGPRQLLGVVWEPERLPTDEIEESFNLLQAELEEQISARMTDTRPLFVVTGATRFCGAPSAALACVQCDERVFRRKVVAS